jgi:hypothetical protein
MAQEDSKDNKNILNFRPISDDGKTPRLVLSIFFDNFEKSQ